MLATLAACATLVVLCAWAWRSPQVWQRVLVFCGIVAVAAWGGGREARAADASATRGTTDTPTWVSGTAPDAAHPVPPAVAGSVQQEQASMSGRNAE